MNYIIGDENYDPEGMVAFQAQRRLELHRWYRGDRSVPGPANWIEPPVGLAPVRVIPAPPLPIPAPVLRPMSEAPRDGSKIKLHRKPHPNLKFPVVEASWKQWAAHHGFWFASGFGVIGSDEYTIGWEKI